MFREVFRAVACVGKCLGQVFFGQVFRAGQVVVEVFREVFRAVKALAQGASHEGVWAVKALAQGASPPQTAED